MRFFLLILRLSFFIFCFLFSCNLGFTEIPSDIVCLVSCRDLYNLGLCSINFWRILHHTMPYVASSSSIFSSLFLSSSFQLLSFVSLSSSLFCFPGIFSHSCWKFLELFCDHLLKDILSICYSPFLATKSFLACFSFSVLF